MNDDASRKRKVPQKNDELTTAQKHALEVWLAFEREHGAPPNGATFARLLDVTRQQAHEYQKRLREKGFIAPRRVTITRLRSTAKARKIGP